MVFRSCAFSSSLRNNLSLLWLVMSSLSLLLGGIVKPLCSTSVLSLVTHICAGSTIGLRLVFSNSISTSSQVPPHHLLRRKQARGLKGTVPLAPVHEHRSSRAARAGEDARERIVEVRCHGSEQLV